MVITGRSSLSDYQDILSTVTFSSTDTPLDSQMDALTRIITISVFDGRLNSNIVTVHVRFFVNNPPVITIPIPMVTLPYGDTTVLIAPSGRITDSDNQLLQNMTVELESMLADGTLQGGSQTTRVLVFNHRTPAEFTAIPRSINYISTAPDASLPSQAINIQACDSLVCRNNTVSVNIGSRGLPIAIIAAVE